MGTLQSKLILSLVDKISRPIKGVNSAVDSLREAQKRNDAAIRRTQTQMLGAVGVAYALQKALAAPIEAAKKFEAEMSNVSTLIDTNVESMDSMGNEVLKIARRTPVALSELTSSLYDIRSAGIQASDAMGVLEGSARLAVSGLGTTKEATDLVTSAINAFSLEGKEQKEIYDQIFTAVKNGKTTISALAQGFGAVAGTVANAGIKIDEYLSSVAALTTSGLPAAQAHTQIRAAIAGLTRETKLSQKIFKNLGAKSFKDLIKKSGGVVEAFKKIKEQTKNDAELLKLVGSVEAYNAIIGLTGKNNAAFVDTLNDMRDGVSNVDAAFEKQAMTNERQLQSFKNNIEEMSIALGQALLPSANKLMQALIPLINAIADFAKNNPELAATLVKVAAGLIALRIAAIALKFSLLWMKGGAIIAAIQSLKLLGGSARVAGFGLRSMAAVGMFPFKALIGGAKRATISLYAFSVAARLTGVGSALAIVGSTGAKSFLRLLNPLRLATVAMRVLKVAVIGTGIGAILVAIAAAGTAIYNNWSGIKEMFKAFGSAFMEALGPAKPVIDPIINAVKKLGDLWNSFFGSMKASDESWASFGASAGKAVGDAVKWFIELPKRIAKAIGEIKLGDFIKWPEPPGWWKKLFGGGGDEKPKTGSEPKVHPRRRRRPSTVPQVDSTSVLNNSVPLPEPKVHPRRMFRGASQKAKTEMTAVVSAVREGGNQASAEAINAGAKIKEGMSITARPNIDTSSIDRALQKSNALKNSIRSVGGASVSGDGIAGARATGGSVAGGKTYLVGERGPELVTPQRSGYVHNASDTARMYSNATPSSLAPLSFNAGANLGQIQPPQKNIEVNINVESVSDKDDLLNYIKNQMAQDIQDALSGAQGDTDWAIG